MKRFVLLFVGVIAFIFMTDAFAQDFQARFLAHPQVVVKGKFGLASWGILPDVTARYENWRTLTVAGLMYKDDVRFIELMGGTLNHQNDPKGIKHEREMNIRYQETSIKPLTFFLDIHANDSKLLIGSFVNRPIGNRKRFFYGYELELINLVKKQDLFSIGPRTGYILVPKKLSVAATFQLYLLKSPVLKDEFYLRTYLRLDI